MQLNFVPFNIDLLILDKAAVAGIRPVTVLDIFSPGSRNFHPDGLFSIETFGRVGEARRNRSFSYIDLRISILHPLLFKTLCDLKQLYGDIMAGKAYAVWDAEIKDFVKAGAVDGKTGFSFFLEHFPDLKFEERNSDRREFNIKLIEKYRDTAMMTRLAVMPAGLRDYEIDENGKPSENEINTYYRQILSLTNLIDPSMLKGKAEIADSGRYSLQVKVYELYDYIKAMLEGKRKFILGRWASRRIFDTTRNVITALNNSADELDSPVTVSYNQTVVGLYQYLKSTMPVSINHIRSGYLQQVFQGPNAPAFLVNKNTLHKELVHITPEHYDDWMTNEGIERTVTKFGENDLRHLPVVIEGRYLGLLYKGALNGKPVFRFIQDISELPDGFDKKLVSPITYTELLYLAVHRYANEMPCLVTRYPVIEFGSIYPSYVFLKTTVRSEIRAELDANWEVSEYTATQFPILNEPFVSSMSPHPSHLGRLGADFDGDMTSCNILFTDEAKKEVKALLSSRKYYVSVNGKMNFSAGTDTLNYVLSNITGDPS